MLRKSKAPRKSPEKWTFLSLAFYNAPSLHTVENISWGFWFCRSSSFVITKRASELDGDKQAS